MSDANQYLTPLATLRHDLGAFLGMDESNGWQAGTFCRIDRARGKTMSGSLTNRRSVRKWESGMRNTLRQRRILWLHGLWIGLITLAVTWGVSAVQLALGVDSMAVRYLVSLGAGYAVYLVILRIWAAALLGRVHVDGGDLSGVDFPDLGNGGCTQSGLPSIHSGGGGDFGGGGASGDYAVDVPGVPDGVVDAAGSAIEVAAGSDEAAIVVVPVVGIFLIACALVFGAGSLALLYFGWEVLLAVAIELAFSYVSARAAVRVTRAGWASTAVRLTWKPLAGALVCAVTLGATVDHFLPGAHTLPQALKIVKAQLQDSAKR